MVPSAAVKAKAKAAVAAHSIALLSGKKSNYGPTFRISAGPTKRASTEAFAQKACSFAPQCAVQLPYAFRCESRPLENVASLFTRVIPGRANFDTNLCVKGLPCLKNLFVDEKLFIP